MNGLDQPHTRARAAVMLSIAAHLCALLLLAALLADAHFPTPISTENGAGPAVTLFVRRERAVRVQAAISSPAPASTPRSTVGRGPRRRAHSTPPAGRERAQATPVVRPGRPVDHRPGKAPLARAPDAPPAMQLTPAPAPLPKRIPTSGPLPLLIQAPTPLPTAPPTPVPAPSSAPTSTPASAAAGNFGGLFSQNYPPAFSAASEFAAIRSRLNGPVHIRVNVDETGRATEVEFVQPVADAALAQEVRSALLALHYVPADCNGLHCEGTLEIAY